MADPIPVPPEVLARMAREKLAAAYRAVFGFDEKSRSETQILVWNDLQKAGYAKQPVFVPDRLGALCPLRAAYADGRRSVILYLEANATFAPEVVQQPQI